MASVVRKLVDIGANLTDPMFQGIYHGSKKHEADLPSVLQRAWDQGLEKIIITGGSLDDSKESLKLAETHEKLFSTVGCHPTRCQEFEALDNPDEYLESLCSLAKDNKGKIVAVGEFGLDYDRLEFCPKDIQKRYFERQLDIAEASALPLFLHCRNAAADLVDILSRNRDRFRGGVVHSFDSSIEDAKSILDLGLSIGINGCSLKTAENLEVVKHIPDDRLLIETDCPWCEVRPSHAGYKHIKTSFPAVKKEKWLLGSMMKNRNEPANIVQVLEIVAAVKGVNIESLCETIYNNTNQIFFAKS